MVLVLLLLELLFPGAVNNTLCIACCLLKAYVVNAVNHC
jgi:hypothetical protein